jgi:glutamate 5-kinase
MDKKESLLLANIRKVKGQFKQGEVVLITDTNGEKIGLGVVNYSSAQLLELQNLSPAKRAAYQKPAVDSKHLVCHLPISVPVSL